MFLKVKIQQAFQKDSYSGVEPSPTFSLVAHSGVPNVSITGVVTNIPRCKLFFKMYMGIGGHIRSATAAANVSMRSACDLLRAAEGATVAFSTATNAWPTLVTYSPQFASAIPR